MHVIQYFTSWIIHTKRTLVFSVFCVLTTACCTHHNAKLLGLHQLIVFTLQFCKSAQFFLLRQVLYQVLHRKEHTNTHTAGNAILIIFVIVVFCLFIYVWIYKLKRPNKQQKYINKDMHAQISSFESEIVVIQLKTG